MPKQPKQKTTAAKDTEILAILKNVSLFKDFRDDETELRKIIPNYGQNNRIQVFHDCKT